MTPFLVMGIDVGTTGVRILVVDGKGSIRASASERLPRLKRALPAGWFEQSPLDWWQAVQKSLASVLAELNKGGMKPKEILALSVTSTSGTILPLDGAGKPLQNAIMYNDNRSAAFVDEVRQAGRNLEEKLGYAFSSAFALPKILWLARREPGMFQKTAWFAHAADYITGRLTGIFNVSDHSNCLKTGFDLIDYDWPSFIERDLDIPLKKLPDVVRPGTVIGPVSTEVAEQTGLATSTLVVAGMTDGAAAQLASGTTGSGSWNSILGTTLVIKGISRNLIRDPLGRFYCHLHPQGYWMPGGASNTGTAWIGRLFSGLHPKELDNKARPFLPTGLVNYPLVQKGERFPFRAPEATGFYESAHKDRSLQYAANLEGLAYLERLAYETLIDLGAKIESPIFVTGGGARSEIWLKIRASVLSRRMIRPRISETAMGAALLAASTTLFDNLKAASADMVKKDLQIDPEPEWEEVYDQGYQRFLTACQERGYIH